MKYYELNGRGNKLGPSNLQCPLCGNAAVGMAEGKKQIQILSSPSGDLIINDITKKIIIGDSPILCPQCNIVMIDQAAVREYHEKEFCPGCIICGRIYKNIFNTCKDCIMAYNDTATNCNECRYNYSRIQYGINLGEMKIHFGIELSDSEIDCQLELFDTGKRRIYSKQSVLGGSLVYEQITQL